MAHQDLNASFCSLLSPEAFLADAHFFPVESCFSALSFVAADLGFEILQIANLFSFSLCRALATCHKAGEVLSFVDFEFSLALHSRKEIGGKTRIMNVPYPLRFLHQPYHSQVV